eukprot:sb/3476918/
MERDIRSRGGEMLAPSHIFSLTHIDSSSNEIQINSLSYSVWRRRPHLSAPTIKWSMAPPYSSYSSSLSHSLSISLSLSPSLSLSLSLECDACKCIKTCVRVCVVFSINPILHN